MTLEKRDGANNSRVVSKNKSIFTPLVNICTEKYHFSAVRSVFSVFYSIGVLVRKQQIDN